MMKTFRMMCFWMVAASLAGMALPVVAAEGGPKATIPTLTKLSKKDIRSYSELSPFELKNTLLDLAGASARDLRPKGSILNAGRGNPNFLNTTVREAYALLTLFAAKTAGKRSGVAALGYRPDKKGLAGKLTAFLRRHRAERGAVLLRNAVRYAEKTFDVPADDLVFELTDAALGDFYPSPPRILPITEKIVFAYMSKIHFRDREPPAGTFHLFATEGATAAMVYIFKSLRENRILKPKDEIAIVTPIFSPYLEIPLLADYRLRPIYIAGNEDMGWHVPDSEIDKLKDKSIKAIFMVNPMNPGSVSMPESFVDRIAGIIRTSRPDLIVLTDTVYAPFVDDFHDLIEKAPSNTICVYSYSKYFGVTGWRLGVIMLHEDNVIDRMIAKLPSRDRKALHKRYLIDSTEPESIKFIDRLVMDSRDVALAHTGGLSTPQQSIMALFSLFELMDETYAYKRSIQKILRARVQNLYRNLGVAPPKGADQTHYYALLDLGKMAQSNYGKDFLGYLEARRSPLDILFTLAKNKQTVLLPGKGFAGPSWSIRVSLANLKDDDYTAIGENIHAVMKDFHDDWTRTDQNR